MVESDTGASGARRHAFLAALALVALVCAVFGQVAQHEFVDYDTAHYLTSNPRVLAGLGLENLRWALTHAHAANWHPLTWWSHMLDVELFGVAPRGHHLVNVAWHAANAVLVFLCFLRMTERAGRSFVVALFFALHPLHVESVAWVVERKDVLSTFFGLVAILAYAAWTKRSGALRYAAVFLALALGLMAKPMLVTWPFVFLLLDVWPLRRLGFTRTRVILEKLPFLALAIASSVLTVWAQSAGAAIQHLEHLSLSSRVGNALAAYVEYLRQTFSPVDLAFFYPHPIERAPGVVAGSAALLLALTAAAFLQRKRAPWFTVGWLWFLGTLVPVIGLVQVGGQARADRYTYIPLIGLTVALVWAVAEWFVRIRAPRWIAPAAAVVVTAVLAALTWRQVATWRTTEAMCTHALAVTEKNNVAHDLLGIHFVEQGELERGVQELEEALRISPGDADALDNLSVAMLKLGRLEEAEAAARKAVALAPWRPTSHNHLGAVLQMQRKLEEARAELTEALRLQPDHVGATSNLGLVLEQLGQPHEAIRAFEAALALRPDYSPARLSLARLLVRQRDLERAERELRTAVVHEPENEEAWRGLARVHIARGRPREALEAIERVMRIRPDWPPALGDATWVLATADDPTVRDVARAIELGERAAEKSAGRQAAILDALAAAYAAADRFPDAVATATKALARAREIGDAELATRIEKRLAAYRVGRIEKGER